MQPLGSGVVVQQGYSTATDVAMAPCATRAAADWYFAAGSTVGGGQQWLSIFDPFAIDAVVDIEAYSESGFHAPGSLQGLIVRAGSRISVRIDRAVAEQKHVAIGVHVRNNSRVVTTEALVRPSPSSRTGISLSLGAISPARVWLLADNRSRVGALQQLVLANPGDVDATVRVSVVPDVASVHSAIVHNGHVARFYTVNRVQALRNFGAANHDNPALIASTTAAMMPVSFDVAATGSTWITPLRQYLDARPGVATVVTAATQRPLVADELVVLNPGRSSVHVSVVATAAGSVLSGRGLRDVLVGPGGAVTISLVGLARTGAAAVVTATGPVVAERFVGGPWGVTRSEGVPAG